MLYFTLEEHQEVVRRLVNFCKAKVEKASFHPAGIEYTSLLYCFLLHNLSAAETLLRISSAFTSEWFPVTIGYSIARTMFEADVTAHYIAKAPVERARQYIDYGKILNKRKMDACRKHRNSNDQQWREAMNLLYQQHWASRESDIVAKFDAVAPQFMRQNKKGKEIFFKNWSGKTIREMAIEVEHIEAYDIFYAELSSFAHVDVHLADCFLKHRSDGFTWSQKAEEYDVANVFRHAATFLTCYAKLFGNQFKTWTEVDVQVCWAVNT